MYRVIGLKFSLTNQYTGHVQWGITILPQENVFECLEYRLLQHTWLLKLTHVTSLPV